MRLVTTQQPGRKGFTLIELLVVIAIIGILVSLTAAAVMKLTSEGPKLQNVQTIQQLSVALETFKQKFGTYPPSRIYLANSLNAYTSAPAGSIQQESYAYLTQIFPRINLNQVSWQGVGAQGVVLEGDQCLVFFLGGVIQNGGCVGFSTNPARPDLLPQATGELRLGPYFTFNTTQLILPSTRMAPFTPLYPVYLDPYLAKPYAYFSSLKRSNGYNTLSLPQLTAPPPGAIGGDCPDLAVQPYWKNNAAPIQFYNPDSFQIISAGQDTVFGLGGFHPPGGPVANGPNAAVDQGADDFSNFAGGQLGAGL